MPGNPNPSPENRFASIYNNRKADNTKITIPKYLEEDIKALALSMHKDREKITLLPINSDRKRWRNVFINTTAEEMCKVTVPKYLVVTLMYWAIAKHEIEQGWWLSTEVPVDLKEGVLAVKKIMRQSAGRLDIRSVYR